MTALFGMMATSGDVALTRLKRATWRTARCLPISEIPMSMEPLATWIC